MTKNNISIRNLSPERSVIDIEGTIGVDENLQFNNPGARVATYEKLTETLLRISEIEAPEVVVNIRSTGGDVNDALLIYEALKSLPGRVVTCCYGYTASAATVIAQAASAGCRRIASSALYLIHNSICATEGNVAELEASTDLLRKTDERLATLYAERSGAPVGGFIALMAENNGAGRWLSPAEAVEAGLADVVIDDSRREDSADGQKGTAAGKNGVGTGNTADSLRAEVAAGETVAADPAEGSRTTGGTETPGEFRGDGTGLGAAGAEEDATAGRDCTATADGNGTAMAAGERAATVAGDHTATAAGDCAATAEAEGLARGTGKEAGKGTENSVGKGVAGSAEKPATGWRALVSHLRSLFAGGSNEAEGTEEGRMREVRDERMVRVAPPVDKNIFHMDDPDPLREMIRSRIAFNRGQNDAKPTATRPVEDPAAYEYQRSANERAYAEDARRMCM